MSDQQATEPATASSKAAGDKDDLPESCSNSAGFEVPALPEGSSGLQPRLHSIFAEVQANLPSIDFEISDVSSDEELSIFSRSIRSPDLDKQQHDKELSPETWQAALQPSSEYLPQQNHESVPTERRSSGGSSRSGSSAAELQRQDPSIVQIGDNIPMKSALPDFTGQKMPPVWNEMMSALRISMPNTPTSPADQNSNLLQSEVAKKTVMMAQRDANRNLVTGTVNINNSNLEKEDLSKEEMSLNQENQTMSLAVEPIQIPTLDVQQIEDIDLDLLLEAFPHPGVREDRIAEQRNPVPSNAGDGSESNLSLMDKLTQLCITQSGGKVTKESLTNTKQQSKGRGSGVTSNSIRTGGRVSHKTINIVWDGEEDDTRSMVRSSTRSDVAVGHDNSSKGTQTNIMGMSASSQTGSPSSSMGHQIRKTAWMNSKTQMTRETVYMDLRGFDQQKKEEKPAVSDAVKRILQIHSSGGSESSSDSDSESEGDLQSWLDQRKAARAATASLQQDRNGTKDLQQAKTPGESKDVLAKERKIRTSSAPVKMAIPATTVTPTRPEKPVVSTQDENPPHESKTLSTLCTIPSETAAEHEKKRRVEAAKKLREQREQEKASRLRLQKRLEALCPTTSVSGKHPAAEATDVLFDCEASYTSAPHSLPPFMSPTHECVLLTAHLSTSGELLLHNKGGSSSTNRSVDHNSGLSATYPVLLTWLLSLVPKNFDFMVFPNAEKDEMFSVVPFVVVGMQQTWQENHFVFNVAVVPSDIEMLLPPKQTKKSKVRSEIRECTPFQKFVIKFLASQTLHSVCPWVQEVFSLAVSSGGQMMSTSEQVYRDGVLRDGSYIPPLPYISNKTISSFLTVNHNLDARKIFNTPTGFFWQTVDSDELMCNQYASEDYDSATDVQNTMSLVYNLVYGNPYSMNGVLHRVIQEGLDLSGVRLLYATEDMSPLPPSYKTQESVSIEIGQIGLDLKRINEVGPILALGLRGALARTRWLDAIGPSDPQLARRTDPKSLMALFGGASRDEATFYCPRQPSRVNHEMCIWFGGRVPSTGVVEVGVNQVKAEHKARGRLSNPKIKKCKKGHQQHEDTSTDRFPINLDAFRHPVSTLVATTSSDILLTVAPIVPPMCVATLLATCQSRGFQLRGIRRLRLNHYKATSIGLSGSQVRIFSPVSCTTPTSPDSPQEKQLKEDLEAEFANATHSPMPSLIVLLRKENAMHQSASLVESLMVTLSVQGMLTTIAGNCPSGNLSSNLCFHVSPYSDTLLNSLGGDFTRVPEGEYTGLRSSGAFYSNPELEQIAVVTFSGSKVLKTVGNKLGKLLGLYPITSENQTPSSIAQGLELLGIKWLPLLTSAQAREITPYEVGDRNWQPSIHTLASNPALVCVVRGIGAFQIVRDQLGIVTQQNIFQQVKFNLEVLVAPSAETAFRQATIFFRDPELFADPSMRVNLPYLPPIRNPTLEEMSITRFAWADEGSPKGTGKRRGKGRHGKGVLVVEESILKTMLTGPRPLNTVLVIKPYAVRRHLSKILKRTIQEGFTIVAMKLTVLTAEEAMALLSKTDQQNDFLQAMHVDHLTSGPIVVLCLQRENAVRKLLSVLGPAHPQEARKLSQFLWRALYGADPINNALHGSINYSRAVAEQKLLFPDGVCCSETPDLKGDQILCPALDTIMGSHQASKRTFAVKAYPVRMDSSESLSAVNSNHSLHDNTASTQSSGVSTSTIDLLLAQHSALCQINCLVLTPPVQLFSVKGHKQGHVQVIDGLLSHGFEIVAMRMVWFQQQQAQEYVSICSKRYPKLVDILCLGPCIVLAVQRDNAVSCFESAMESSYDPDSVMKRYGEHILRAKDTKEAANHLEFFFDQLAPRSQGEILTKD